MKLGNLETSFRLGLLTPSQIYRGSNLVWQSADPDAADYFARITAAGSSISPSNQAAVNAFILGCKADGIWSAIKASCLLAGPDSLAGALVPLVGAAPTNNNFVAADYSRTTGLKGNGSTKYLDTNRNNNADPQDSKHLAAWKSANNTVNGGLIGNWAVAAGSSWLFDNGGLNLDTIRINNSPSVTGLEFGSSGFVGSSRATSAAVGYRLIGVNYSAAATSVSPQSENISVLRSAGSFSNAAVSYYSIGESLNLSLLNTRLATYMSSLT